MNVEIMLRAYGVESRISAKEDEAKREVRSPDNTNYENGFSSA